MHKLVPPNKAVTVRYTPGFVFEFENYRGAGSYVRNLVREGGIAWLERVLFRKLIVDVK